ncbi:cobyric acid synthase [Peribacillus alkalitolerans]|uniref:cobyric acid synthase n=1 Tax=Peribacillus alkalitolerans TaxID=1550385 RepID=UPI0013D73323|nr:cobyric acid synthase [Peribacillus alkalitolerans]
MKGVMLQGTASDVGKSLITTALCKIFHDWGYKTSPFKSQNMSNNSYVTVDGKEIGRAQGVQAEAAGVEGNVFMNPILLKPKSEQQSDIIFFGESVDHVDGREYRDNYYEKGIEAIGKSLAYLDEHFDVVIMEGAGSPVEINLKSRELVNMKVAELADVPVILIADIDRGGVFASIVGTLQLLSEDERKRVKGIIINKFRGDISLFENGIHWIEEQTGVKVVGVLPYLQNHGIESEDSLSLQTVFQKADVKPIEIGIIRLPYVSNYTDLEPFLEEEDVRIRWISSPSEFGKPDAIILPGTRSTIQDLQHLQGLGLDQMIRDHAASGGTVVGICGGYQMLGETLLDVSGLDTGKPTYSIKGFGVLPITTEFHVKKKTIRSTGTLHPDSGFPSIPVEGYEIHVGVTEVLRNVPPFILQADGNEGISLNNGAIIGTYFHHIFNNDVFRNEWLNSIRKKKGLPTKAVVPLAKFRKKRYEELATHVQEHLDMAYIRELVLGVLEE